jgi:PPOX class probable F420-dependent enzyme
MAEPPPAWAEELLRSARVGRLGTADAAGRPLVVPVCYVYDGRACYSAIDAKPKRTRSGLRRLRNVAENPRASLVVDHYEEDWTRLCYVIVEGAASIVTAGPELPHAIDLLLAKYPQYRTLGLTSEGGTVIRLAAERIVAWRYA